MSSEKKKCYFQLFYFTETPLNSSREILVRLDRITNFREIIDLLPFLSHRNEINVLVRKNMWLSIVESLTFSWSIVAAFLAILTLIGTGQPLTPSKAFVVLSFMNLLRLTLCIRLPNALPIAFELWISLSRIERFLLLQNLPRLSNNKNCQEPSGQEDTFEIKHNSYLNWLKDSSLEHAEHHESS